jgi:hypothetical protein
VLFMSNDDLAGKVWLYEGGAWDLADDPISWDGQGSDVRGKYAAAGYSELPGKDAAPFLILGLHSEDVGEAAQLVLFVRRTPPQCLIEIEGSGGSCRTVYATRLPEGLDLMARWAPIASAGMLTAIAKDLVQAVDAPIDSRGRRTGQSGLVESVTRRLARTLP